MFKNLRIMIVEHIGAIIVTIFVILALYYIFTQVVFTTSDTTKVVSDISNILDKSTLSMYDQEIISGSQVLAFINNYYNNSDMMILLLNDPKDYERADSRFWVTGKGGRYRNKTNAFANDYENILSVIVSEGSINNEYTKKPLSSFRDANEKNYINVATNYRSVLVKCNSSIVGVAFFAI